MVDNYLIGRYKSEEELLEWLNEKTAYGTWIVVGFSVVPDNGELTYIGLLERGKKQTPSIGISPSEMVKVVNMKK